MTATQLLANYAGRRLPDDSFTYPYDVLETPRGAVARAYFETPGRMDIRSLWNDHRGHYFRVNWWRHCRLSGEQRIWRSTFVVVHDTDDGFVVRELDVRIAA